MNRESTVQLIQVAGDGLTKLAREVLVSKKERQIERERIEKEKEIAQLQAMGATASSETAESDDSDPSDLDAAAADAAERMRQTVEGTDASDEAAAVTVDIEPLIEDETCSMCVTLLETVEDMDAERRAIGLAEYGRMKQAVDDGADADEVREFIDGTDVLSEALADLKM